MEKVCKKDGSDYVKTREWVCAACTRSLAWARAEWEWLGLARAEGLMCKQCQNSVKGEL